MGNNQTRYRATLVGLPGCGKRAMLPTFKKKLKLNYEIVEINERQQQFIHNTDVIIYVVDASDRTNLETNKFYVNQIMKYISSQPVLILCNMYSNSGALSVSVLAETFCLIQLRNIRWYIQACSVKDNEGVEEGIDWVKYSIDTKIKIQPVDIVLLAFREKPPGILYKPNLSDCDIITCK